MLFFTFQLQNGVLTGISGTGRRDVTAPGRNAQGKWDAQHTFEDDAARRKFDTRRNLGAGKPTREIANRVTYRQSGSVMAITLSQIDQLSSLAYLLL